MAVELVIKISKELYDLVQNKLDFNGDLDKQKVKALMLAIDNGTPLPNGCERLINADELARRIAGHSDYHGDDILSAIYCMAEGKHSDEPIKPLEREQEPDLIKISAGFKEIEEYYNFLESEE